MGRKEAIALSPLPVLAPWRLRQGCVEVQASLSFTKTQSLTIKTRAWSSGSSQAQELRLGTLEGVGSLCVDNPASLPAPWCSDPGFW